VSTLTIPQAVMVPVDKIDPSPANNRIDKDAEIESLAASIRAQGLLQPPTVRPHPSADGRYEMVCGERRWRACRTMAEEIPVVIRDLDDQAAHDITVTENMHREDLHPLEEAAGVQTLLDDGRSIEEVADRLGKPPAWVARRAKLTNLSPVVRERLARNDDDSGIQMWTGSHLELLARFEHHIQEEFIAKWCGDMAFGDSVAAWTVADLAKQLDEYLLKLKAAPWKLSDAELVPEAGACDQCVKRTSCQQDLFDPMEEKGKSVDRCLDRACWARKMEAYIDAKADRLREGVPDLMLLDCSGRGTAYFDRDHKLKGSALSHYQCESLQAKKTDEGARQALIIDGPGAGTVRWVKPWESGGGIAAPRAKGQPRPLAERRDALAKKRNKYVIGEVIDVIEREIANPDLITRKPTTDILIAAASFETQSLEHATDGDDYGYGWHWYETGGWASVKKLQERQLEVEDLAVELARCMLPEWKSHLQGIYGAAKPDLEAATKMCEWLGVNIDNLIEQAAEKHNEPKAWANLNEDGTPKMADERARPGRKSKSKKGDHCE